MPSSRGLPWPRDWTCVSNISCIGRWAHYCEHHQGSPPRPESSSTLSFLWFIFLEFHSQYFFSCVCPLPFITDTLLIHIHYFSPRWQHKLLSFFSHQQYPSSAAYQLHSLSWSSVPPSTPKDSRLRNILFPECLPNEIIYFGLHQVQTARPYIKSLKQPGVTYFFWKKQLSLALRAIQSLSRSLNSAVVWKQP